MPTHVIQNASGQLTGLKLKPASITADLTVTDEIVVLADATAAIVTVTLPAAAAGRTVTVKKVDATNDVVIATPGAETIDGAADHTLTTQWAAARLVSDGTNWFVV